MSEDTINRPAGDQAPKELTYIDYFGLIGSDLARIVKKAWAERIVWGAGVLLCLVIGIAIALFSEEKFSAEATLLPNDTQESGIGSGISSKLGAASSLIGLGGGKDVQELIAALQSRALIYRFIDRYQVARDLFPQLWDSETQQWRKVTPGAASRLVRWLNEKPEPAPQYGPTREDTYATFLNILAVSQAGNTDMIHVSITWKDPEKAATWVNGIVRMLNDTRRQEFVAQSKTRIALLNTLLMSTTSVETRSALVNLIQTQTESSVSAQSQTEFALRSLDPAVVPQYRAWPKRGLIVVLSLVLGFLASGLFAAFCTPGARKIFGTTRRSGHRPNTPLPYNPPT